MAVSDLDAEISFLNSTNIFPNYVNITVIFSIIFLNAWGFI